MKRLPAKKVAISIPAALYKEAERTRRSQGRTRSEFFREAVEKLLEQEREREASERYVRSYREDPESPGDAKAFSRLAAKSWRDLPWR